MLDKKTEMIQLLTGIKSSKRTYYMELKETISQLQKKNMQLEIISDVMKNMKIDMSIENILESVMEKLKKIIKFDRLSVSLYENDTLVLTSVHPSISYFFETGTPIPDEKSLYWQVVRKKQTVYYSISALDKKHIYFEEESLKKIKIDSLLLLPLMSKNQVIGVLSFGSMDSVFWDEADVAFLEQLSDYLSVSIENAHLYNEVLRSKKEWEDTFKAVVDVLIVVDKNHNILRFNEAAAKFLKLDEKNMYGQKGCKILSCMDANCECLIAESFTTKKTSYRQLSIKNDRICEVYTFPMFNDLDEMYGVIVYMKDVTERLEMEAQLMHSGKLAAIGEMAAGVAHELNSPLTAILGNSQLLLRETPKEQATYKLLHDILTCGNRCKNIIRSLLTFSRQDQYQFEECSINQAVNQVLNFVRYQIERKNIEIILMLDSHLPMIKTSIQHIEQIFINLLLNAKDALQEGEVVQKQIIIRTGIERFDEKDWVFLSVQDNGMGMTESIMKEAFHPFFTTKESVKGTGLGLSVSLGIAKAHGGTIHIESEPKKGSIFKLHLPLDSAFL